MTSPTKYIAAAAATLALAAMPAIAGDQAAVPSTEIDITGLDLTQQQGAEVAYVRIKRAARDVCDVPRGIAPVRERLAAKACVDAAIDRAVAAVGSRQLALVQRRDKARG